MREPHPYPKGMPKRKNTAQIQIFYIQTLGSKKNLFKLSPKYMPQIIDY